jgi:dolichol-phosphate mannosyltransferase
MKIVVIIPSFNEKENLKILIDELEREFKKINKHEMWILNVDANSPDGTADFIRKKIRQYGNIDLYLEKKKEGLGAAYLKGMRYAMRKMKAGAVIEFDADLQHNPKYVPELVKKMDLGYQCVIGSRYIPGGGVPTEWGLSRKIFSLFGGLYTRLVLFLPNFKKFKAVTDPSSGLKLTRVKGVLDSVDFSKIGLGFYYKTQMLYQIVNLGAKMGEIPIKFGLRRQGKSKMPVSNAIETFKVVTLLRLKDPATSRFLKFAIVGFIGYLVNALGLEVFYRLGFSPGLAAAFGAEFAIISNFTLNNLWTFAEKKIIGIGKIILKFLQFNLTSFGAVLLQGLVVGILAVLFGEGLRQIYLIIAIGFFVIPYNYTMYNIFIWKTWKIPFLSKFQRKTS